jgi:hypothetical protein
MSLPARLVALLLVVAAVFSVGLGTGIKWQRGVQAQADVAAADARAADAKRQIRALDTASSAQAATLSKLNNQLGDARAQIALLSGRECFSADTVGVLNTIGGEPVPTPASQPASETAAPASGTGIRFATERDAAGYIALCRARYAEVAAQLNAILDVEEARAGLP